MAVSAAGAVTASMSWATRWVGARLSDGLGSAMRWGVHEGRPGRLHRVGQRGARDAVGGRGCEGVGLIARARREGSQARLRVSRRRSLIQGSSVGLSARVAGVLRDGGKGEDVDSKKNNAEAGPEIEDSLVHSCKGSAPDRRDHEGVGGSVTRRGEKKETGRKRWCTWRG